MNTHSQLKCRSFFLILLWVCIVHINSVKIIAQQEQKCVNIPIVAQGIPLLCYIFFEAGNASIPVRYKLFKLTSETNSFNEDNVIGEFVDVHSHTLNIIGSRMRLYPHTKISIIGNNSNNDSGNVTSQLLLGETKKISEQRAQTVYNYLTLIWRIDSQRITILPARNVPYLRSNPKTLIGLSENRRVEIESNDWEVIRPIFYSSSIQYQDMDSVKIKFSLIQFEFDSPKPGKINERILKELIFPLIKYESQVAIVGSRDTLTTPLNDRSLCLALNRAHTISKMIGENLSGKHVKITAERKFVGDHPLPEERFAKRGVEISITAPLYKLK